VKTLLVSGPWTGAPDYRPTISFIPPWLRLRRLMPNLTTASNLVTGPRETAATAGADYQTTEGSAKGASDFTFQLGLFPVCTIATYATASRQVLDDSASFAGYVDVRLRDMVENKVEKELLYGDGATGHITGLTVNATAGGGGATSIDKIGGSLAALATAGILPDAVVVTPTDWFTMVAAKNAGGDYPSGAPALLPSPPTVFGVRIVFSNQMATGHYLAGDFADYAAVFNREAATMEIARSHMADFTANMVEIRDEERLALAIYRPTAFVYGAL
jgi:HK97 family phage major capsid protein